MIICIDLFYFTSFKIYRRCTQMLQHSKSLLEYKSGLIAAHPVKFHRLVTEAQL
jgi:hypothetical protein